MKNWNGSELKLALDIIDWYRLWGDKQVDFSVWYGRLCPHLKESSAQRTWLRTRQRLMRSKRYKQYIEVSASPLSFHGGLAVAVFYGAALAAENFLDDVARERQRRAAARDEARRVATEARKAARAKLSEKERAARDMARDCKRRQRKRTGVVSAR